MGGKDIGLALVTQGVLNRRQADTLLNLQQREHRPIDDLAVERFGIERHDIHSALSGVFLPQCPHVDLTRETFDEQALSYLPAREAWEHLILPLRIADDQLICATTAWCLAEAIAYIQQSVPIAFQFVLTDLPQLEQFIAERYDYDGVDFD